MLAAGWLGYACNRAFFEGNNFSSTKATSKSKGTFTMEQNAFSAWLSGQRSLALESWLRVLDLEKAKIFNVSMYHICSKYSSTLIHCVLKTLKYLWLICGTGSCRFLYFG